MVLGSREGLLLSSDVVPAEVVGVADGTGQCVGPL